MTNANLSDALAGADLIHDHTVLAASIARMGVEIDQLLGGNRPCS